MPTYDYKCESCGHRFDAWQKITDDPLAECPVCGGPVHRVLYPVGVLFKGSGFYINDSRASSNGKSSADSGAEAAAEGKPAEGKPAEGKPAEGKPAEGATSEAKTESKSEAKADTKSTSASAEAKPGKAPAAKASE